jgi:ABC-type antimicrobial peptide transport system permease subunit
MVLLTGFAALSLLLAAIGVYGLVSQAVVQRRREVAIRLALGARPSEVIVTVSRPALTATLAGFGLGVPAAFLLGHVLETLLYGVQPRDIWSFVTAGTVLLGAAALAAFVPALHAARVDPSKVLRSD